MHTQCRGETARMAATHHFISCKSILIGFRRQLRSDCTCKDGSVGMLEAGQENSEVVSSLPLLHVGTGDHWLDVESDGGVIYRDGLTGQILNLKPMRDRKRNWISSTRRTCGLLHILRKHAAGLACPQSQSDGWTSTRVTTGTRMYDHNL